MEFWIEGTPDEVIEVANGGLVAAIATNPSIIAHWTADGQPMDGLIRHVCEHVEVPVFVQLHGPTVADYLREMDAWRSISAQIQPKLVATHAGIAAARRIAADGLKPLVTTISTLNQAYLSACAGAAYIAPYVGRIDDAGVNAYQLIADISRMYKEHGIKTQIAAASIRNPAQAAASLQAGAPIIVAPYNVYQHLLDSQMTEDWIERFEANWRQIPGAV